MWRKGKARVLIKIWLRGGLHSPKECVVIGEVGPGGGMMPQIAQVVTPTEELRVGIVKIQVIDAMAQPVTLVTWFFFALN